MSDGPLVLFVMTAGAIGDILHGLASKLDTVLELDRVMCVFFYCDCLNCGKSACLRKAIIIFP